MAAVEASYVHRFIDSKEQTFSSSKFHTTDYDSWKKEREIYDHYSLANEFILKYLGSDITSSESCTTEFWIGECGLVQS